MWALYNTLVCYLPTPYTNHNAECALYVVEGLESSSPNINGVQTWMCNLRSDNETQPSMLSRNVCTKDKITVSIAGLYLEKDFSAF